MQCRSTGCCCAAAASTAAVSLCCRQLSPRGLVAEMSRTDAVGKRQHVIVAMYLYTGGITPINACASTCDTYVAPPRGARAGGPRAPGAVAASGVTTYH